MFQIGCLAREFLKYVGNMNLEHRINLTATQLIFFILCSIEYLI
jgi:hypothetical protein